MSVQQVRRDQQAHKGRKEIRDRKGRQVYLTAFQLKVQQ